MPRISCFEHELVSDLSDKHLAALRRVAHLLPNGCIEWRGPHAVKFQQFCGLIPLDDHMLEVLPKIDGTDDADRSRTTLIKMLAFVGDIDVSTVDLARTTLHDSLLEIIVRIFVHEAERMVRRGLPRVYVSNEEDLTKVRGRLDCIRLALQSPARRHLLPCHFDELTIDNKVSQYIKAAATRAWSVAKRASTRQKVEQVLFLLDDVASVRNIKASDADRLQLNRTTQVFERVLRLSRWLLEAISPDTQAGTSASWGLLFDMNLLFERYVQKQLQRQLPQFSVRFQKPQRKLFDSTATFPLKPDIVVCDPQIDQKIVAIIDAKWKLLARDGTSSADAYQMIAYGTAYQCGQLGLIYPQTASALEKSHCRKDGMCLNVRTIPLPTVAKGPYPVFALDWIAGESA
jgi:5-methylcytosine-specific restriction enzyme subunit McrC